MKRFIRLLEIFYCRTYQFLLKIANSFISYRKPYCIEGENSLKIFCDYLKKENIDDILVVTGESLMKKELLKPMFSLMDEYNIRYFIFALNHTDPTDRDVEKGYEFYTENNCKSIIGFGGGSRIDCAKAIAAKAARPSKSIEDLQGLLKVSSEIPFLAAIPTTAGSGSETTVAAVIKNTKTNRKASINDPSLIPHCVVLNPELTVGLSRFTTAVTGMDALTHAVEAYINHTYNTSLEDDLAKQAVKIIYNNILKVYNDGENIEARQKMQKAAFFAGRAFTVGCVGYVHAVGHTLGGLYGVPHGLAMAVILPYVLRQYGNKAHKRLAELADFCGIKGKNAEDKANSFISFIEEINGKMGIPDKFDMINEKDIPLMIKSAKKEANPLYPVPVIWLDEDFKKLINSIRK